ncbi:MAG: EscU/YscU/HrcU family type III secretion system export apparatus switch protein [Oscillospiraceae bacterium]|nr:EscU/YscU/HrcU family type III secretion system export apparatus switch protein [Oscillospiraceae bacterium]
MSRRDRSAVALRYEGGSGAPVVVASGMGYLAEKIVEVASENGVPVYEDNSLATMLSQLSLGQEIPDSLYRAIVEIYVYFLNFDPNDPDKARRERQAAIDRSSASSAQPAPQKPAASRPARTAAPKPPAGAAYGPRKETR